MEEQPTKTSRTSTITVSSSWSDQRIAGIVRRSEARPFIRLKGKYLAEFGFAVGDKAEVTIDEEQIVIRKIKRTKPRHRSYENSR